MNLEEYWNMACVVTTYIQREKSATKYEVKDPNGRRNMLCLSWNRDLSCGSCWNLCALIACRRIWGTWRYRSARLSNWWSREGLDRCGRRPTRSYQLVVWPLLFWIPKQYLLPVCVSPSLRNYFSTTCVRFSIKEPIDIEIKSDLFINGWL